MISERTFGRQVFEEILRTFADCADRFELRDDGAWLRPTPQRRARDDRHAREILRAYEEANWTPACDLEGVPDSPDPLTSPAVPFPFSARALAAWMLAGWGSQVRMELGEWGIGPVGPALDMLGIRGGKVREALVRAFQAYREAEEVVGALDLSAVLENLDAADPQRADTITRKDGEQVDVWPADPHAESLRWYQKAASASEAATATWRQAMVRQLLQVERPEAAAKGMPGSSEGRPGPAGNSPAGVLPETKEQRQARRYRMCVEAGLQMPDGPYKSLPRGIKPLADREGITRQAFAEDVKAHIERVSRN